ncbi:MAG: cytochrome c biogenesis protein CcdA, partial [Polaribacter sp.]|uniref:cytochrome c biogenesis protein CcdA n=1 Tax=Polaribacter sp. TaxID=1920175 RepID=UPI003BAF4E05
MKKLIIFFILLSTLSLKAQTADEPIKIETSVKKISNTEYDIIFSAKLYKGWYLYSQYNPEDASLPLEISVSEGEFGYKLIGKAIEKDTFKKYSDVWELEEIVFKDKAIITQRIQLINKTITQVKLGFYGQVCETACINFDENFTISLTGKDIILNNSVDEKSVQLTNQLKLDLKNTELLNNSSDSNSESSNGLFSIFILGFVGGLLALLTPCVFPMIPLTVSFFTKQSKNKKKGIFNAILYGVFIVIIYVLLSLPFHFLDNLDPEILNTISTNVWLNIFFFVVLVFFAFSFFGFYEITLPSSWGNKMDDASSVGGIIG